MSEYYPPSGQWEQVDPDQHGIDVESLTEAITVARSHPTPVATDFSNQETLMGPALGPVPDERGGPTGVVLHDGRIVADWGEPERVDLAYSVTKSFLTIVAGIAVDRGLITDVTEPVSTDVDEGLFGTDRERQISWEQLLHQTSEWDDTLFGKHWTADSDRDRDATLNEPGTHWEYNDVRINLLALALLHVWQEPLPEVLRANVMEPIGASESWEWHGYENSTVSVDGKRMKSVSGGGHWGGGLWINSLDLARVGYLLLQMGTWDGQQVLPERWIESATTPCPIKPEYGYLLWLNTDHTLWPSVPATSYAALGYGTNIVWIDPEDDLVAVIRWFGDDLSDESVNEFPATLDKQNTLFRLLREAVIDTK